METELIFTQFQSLYSEKGLPDLGNQFVKDGIIDPVLYCQQSKRILFIAKEHNYREQHDYVNNHADYREWIKSVMYLGFANRLGEWAYGILNDFPEDIDQVSHDDKHTALKSVAFINVKKASGTATANPHLIGKYILESRDLLRQQIEAIAPTVIVCCFRYDDYINHLFDHNLVRAESNAYSVGKWNGIDIINFWHPSSRKSKQFLYDQLRLAVKATRKPLPVK
ncbi:hypothetical protein [Larkinella rosea]|uniref:Uracil-DNA glycosylase n=1 Tax=Larkinella rosea TaxID=2025312 RepID=A0A3P1BSM7_9BACT|nr:hypothetical protein [Larkinella rosea]RRB04108.1 hypothetical protein EHT25_11325 [Larkinella rosea]